MNRKTYIITKESFFLYLTIHIVFFFFCLSFLKWMERKNTLELVVPDFGWRVMHHHSWPRQETYSEHGYRSWASFRFVLNYCKRYISSESSWRKKNKGQMFLVRHLLHHGSVTLWHLHHQNFPVRSSPGNSKRGEQEGLGGTCLTGVRETLWRTAQTCKYGCLCHGLRASSEDPRFLGLALFSVIPNAAWSLL